MTFDKKWLSLQASSGNTDAPLGYSYNGSTTGSNDDLATITASGYFNNTSRFKVGDFIYIYANDGQNVYHVTATSPNTTIETVVAGALPAGTSGQILIPNGSNVPTWVNMTQDATVDENGNITVLAASGSFSMSGPVFKANITSTSGPGAVPVTGSVHQITTTGTGDALTLVDGTNGQRLTLCYVAEGAGGDTAVLTPTTLNGGTTITFGALGESADLIFLTGSGWNVISTSATLA